LYKETVMMPTATTAAVCPECAGTLNLTNVMQGEIVVCPECGVDLEVTAVQPLTLALAPQEAEDWGE
jgi:alpha-aminoadipate carrier protein LysW